MSAQAPLKPAGGGGRSRRWWPGILLAAAFLGLGIATLGDYGQTWDEKESYEAGRENLRILPRVLAGDPEVAWPWHELTGYQFVFDTLRAAFAGAAERPIHRLSGRDDPLLGFHLFNLLLASGSVALTYALALRLTGRVRPALLSALVLASLPKFIAHSQSNPKDSIGLFVFSAAVLAGATAARSGRVAAWLGAGVVTGLALANHVLSGVLPALLAVWSLLAGHGSLRRRLLGPAVLAAAALPTAFAAWPWLWPAPGERLAAAVERVRTFRVPMGILYLGEIFPQAEVPAHYFAVSVVVATPVLFLAAAAAGVATLVGREGPGRPGRRHLAGLATLWLLSLVAAELAATAHYDGVRHVLPVLPALALLAGAGLDGGLAALAELARAGGRRRLVAGGAAGLLALAYAGTIAQLIAIHPYHDAYLNEATRAVVSGPAEEVFELEYWGGAHKEGAAWLNRRVPGPAAVLVPISPDTTAPYLDERFLLVPEDRVRRYDGPVYLMLITRPPFYSPRVRRLRARLEPVFTVRRQGSTLLEIYRLE